MPLRKWRHPVSRKDRSLGTKWFTCAATSADRPRSRGVSVVAVLKVMALLVAIAVGGDVIR